MCPDLSLILSLLQVSLKQVAAEVCPRLERLTIYINFDPCVAHNISELDWPVQPGSISLQGMSVGKQGRVRPDGVTSSTCIGPPDARSQAL